MSFFPIYKYRHNLIWVKLKAVQSNFLLQTSSFGRQYLFTLLPVTNKLKEQTLAIWSALKPILNSAEVEGKKNPNKACKKLYSFQSIHF